MSFPAALRSALAHSFTFRGRASRAEYWSLFLFALVTYLLTCALDVGVGARGDLAGLCVAALFVPVLSVTVRRLHDSGHSGWWVLVGLVPVLGAVLLIVAAGEPGYDQRVAEPRPAGQTGETRVSATFSGT